MFVRYSVTLKKITSKFCLKLIKWVYLNNHSAESINTWAMGTLECLLTFHEFWPQGGAGGENLGPLKSVTLLFLLCLPLLKTLGQTTVIHSYDPAFRIMRGRSERPIFHG